MKNKFSAMRTVLTIALVVNVIISASSQKQEPSLGLRAGINISNGQGSSTNERENRTGFHAGAYVKVGITEQWHLITDICYSMEGAKTLYATQAGYPNGSTESTLNLVNLSLMAEYGKKLRVQAGPQIGLIMSAKEEGRVGSIKVNQNLSNDMSTFQFSAAFGAILSISKKLGVGLRYNHGLNDVYQGDEKQGIELPDAKFRVIQIYLGYTLL
jgi:hypothetical protein